MPAFVSSARKRKRRPRLAVESYRRLLAPLLIFTGIFLADQATKFWAAGNLTSGQSISIIGDFLQFRIVFNEGGALGTSLGSGIFYLITSLIIFGVIIFLITANLNNRIISCALAAIAGGAAGNILDRIRIGRVVDFIDMDFFDINLFGLKVERWWTYNIADSAITVGVIVLLTYMLFFSKRKSPSQLSSPESPQAPAPSDP